MKLLSGHEVVPFNEDEQKVQSELFLAYSDGLITLNPGGWTYTKAFESLANQIYEFEFKPSDVVIMTFPKSGTTWMQEILWTMMKDINMDNEDSEFPASMKCPMIEFDFLVRAPNMPPNPEMDPYAKKYAQKYCKEINKDDPLFLQMAKCSPDPRIIKTHLPFSLLNPKMLDTCKVVYVVRNPKDVLVSFYHHSRVIRMHDYLGDFDKFFELFINDKVVYGPMWPFLKEGWERKSHPNFHLIYFENLKANSFKEISQLDQFLGTGLTKDQIQKVVENTSFKTMKEKDTFARTPGDTPSPMLNKEKGDFFRKGEAGSWKIDFSEEQDAVMDKWIKEHSNEAPFDFKYGIGK